MKTTSDNVLYRRPETEVVNLSIEFSFCSPQPGQNEGTTDEELTP